MANKIEFITITVTAPAAWASYLVNGDASGFDFYGDEEDEQACYAMEAELGCCMGAEEAGFIASPDYGQAGDCAVYTFPAK